MTIINILGKKESDKEAFALSISKILPKAILFSKESHPFIYTDEDVSSFNNITYVFKERFNHIKMLYCLTDCVVTTFSLIMCLFYQQKLSIHSTVIEAGFKERIKMFKHTNVILTKGMGVDERERIIDLIECFGEPCLIDPKPENFLKRNLNFSNYK